MRKINFIFILPFVILIALCNHRAYSSTYVFNKLAYSKYGPASYKEQEKKAPAFVIIRKKSKTKGIKVACPHIPETIFVNLYQYTEYIFSEPTESFSHAYISENKGRAPPAC